ncbi:olfactory receptor 1019-like [Bombina bombina]|uniref:olfactory receptor 1019-like n=1 Tax=Bombina bombina TaxID=8345 RepID=UPI00235B2A45|nr:olfactory receptor 1019-like [Bombina bombina]
MGNQTLVYEFNLSGFTNHFQTQYLVFVIFLLIYLMTISTNLLILFLAFIDSQLHTPMYFFLGNLAFIDMSYSSVTAPRMLCDVFTTNRTISLPACITQVFFFIYFASSEIFLLATMSYDRYVAICHPLHYIQIMSWKACLKFVSAIWILGLLYSLLHTLCSLRLTFCGPSIIHNFFCDLPHLFLLSCTDTLLNVVVKFIAAGILGIVTLAITFVPYAQIFSTVLRIRTKGGKLKAFSTCTSHLTVVSIFYGSMVLIYFTPATNYQLKVNMLANVIYAIINPFLNPLIYSLRNKDLKEALRRVFININA